MSNETNVLLWWITGPVGRKDAADIQLDLKKAFDIVPDDTEVPEGNKG